GGQRKPRRATPSRCRAAGPLANDAVSRHRPCVFAKRHGGRQRDGRIIARGASVSTKKPAATPSRRATGSVQAVPPPAGLAVLQGGRTAGRERIFARGRGESRKNWQESRSETPPLRRLATARRGP